MLGQSGTDVENGRPSNQSRVSALRGLLLLPVKLRVLFDQAAETPTVGAQRVHGASNNRSSFQRTRKCPVLLLKTRFLSSAIIEGVTYSSFL